MDINTIPVFDSQRVTFQLIEQTVACAQANPQACAIMSFDAWAIVL